MAGGNASKSAAEGGVGYCVKNVQIAAGSSFFRPFLKCLLTLGLAIVISDFSNFDTAHDCVGGGWFELGVMGEVVDENEDHLSCALTFG